MRESMYTQTLIFVYFSYIVTHNIIVKRVCIKQKECRARSAAGVFLFCACAYCHCTFARDFWPNPRQFLVKAHHASLSSSCARPEG